MVEEALQQAKAKQIIVLMPTPEYEGAPFPALLKEVVFYIGSADGLGNPSPLNPSPNGAAAFIALGEAVRGAQSGTKTDYTTRDGSAVAVMVASGIASLLIDYTTQRYARGWGADNFENMRSLLLAMSEPTNDSYRYLFPTNLFRKWTDSQKLVREIIYNPESILLKEFL